MIARQLAAEARVRLAAAGIEDAAFEAEYLVRTLGGISRAQYFASAAIEPSRLQAIEVGISARERREPAAYITGEREFWGLRFGVGREVLVPRPETELLVELALRDLLETPANGPVVIVDVGTGSGAVAVAVAHSIDLPAPPVTVVATDVSTGALAFARQNARAHGAPVRFIRGDLLSAVGRADIVLANLPYIPAGETDALEPEVSRWEPRVALDGGEDGFVLIRRLVADCAARLRPRLLGLEVGFGQAAAVRAICTEAGAETSLLKDLAGIDRIVCARWLRGR